MTKEFGHIVSALVAGQGLVLALFVLSYTYQGLWEIVNLKLNHYGGPYWLIQL